MRDNIHVDTSPYAYKGLPTNVNDPYAMAGIHGDDPYAAFGCVDQYTDDAVENFIEIDNPDFGTYDSIFGLGNKQKQAERKLKRAEKKLSKGKTKAAERLISKAQKTLGKVAAGQSNLSLTQSQLASVKATQNALGSYNPDINTGVQPLSAQSMSDVAQAQPIPESGGGMTSDTSDLTGVESTAPDTSDEPTGSLAAVKELPGVTVTSSKGLSIVVIIIAAAVILLGIVYFSKKGKKK